jgi:hypothetical protein
VILDSSRHEQKLQGSKQKQKLYEQTQVRALYEEQLFSRLNRSTQRAWAMPGTFSPMGGPQTPVIEKLKAYAAWAAEEPMLTGLALWHWCDLLAPEPDQMRGAVGMPAVMAWLDGPIQPPVKDSQIRTRPEIH